MSLDSRGYRGRRRQPQEVPWDRILLMAPLVLLGMAVVYLVIRSVYQVHEYEKAVVMRFGKYHQTVDSGLHLCIPLVDEVLKVSTEEHSLRLPFGIGPSRPRNVAEEETLILTADLNMAVVEWTVQWKVVEPRDYLFSFYKEGDPAYPERVITTVAQTVMNRLVGDYSMGEVLYSTGEVLPEKRGMIASEAKQATQDILDLYQCGVQIRDLQMQRVTPPEKVRPAFEQVIASIQKKEQLEYEGKKERNQMVPEAEAERDKLIREAEGYRDRRLAEAEGEISALRAKYEEYKQAPQETRQRLYLEAMEEVLGAIQSKVIVDADLQGRMLPLLPLDQGPTQ
jgi:membrane protease subunit HflK